MAFDMKALKVHGNAGCNIFNSTLVLDGGDISAITIAPGAATMMSCPDMEIEDAVLQANRTRNLPQMLKSTENMNVYHY